MTQPGSKHHKQAILTKILVVFMNKHLCICYIIFNHVTEQWNSAFCALLLIIRGENLPSNSILVDQKLENHLQQFLVCKPKIMFLRDSGGNMVSVRFTTIFDLQEGWWIGGWAWGNSIYFKCLLDSQVLKSIFFFSVFNKNMLCYKALIIKTGNFSLSLVPKSEAIKLFEINMK